MVTEDWAFLKHRTMIAHEARLRGCEVHVASPPGEHARAIAASGFLFHPIYVSRSSVSPLYDMRTLWDLVQLYKAIKPNLVHHIALKPIAYGTAAARMTGVEAVVNGVVGLGYAFSGDGVKRSALRMASHVMFATSMYGSRVRALFQNNDDLNYFAAHRLAPRKNCRIVRGSGVDVLRYQYSQEPTGVPIVLVATRLLWDKGIAEVVEAARILRARRITCRMVLAGMVDRDNPACVPESQLQAWQREGVVEWIGYCDDMPSLHARSHISCLPSYREGLPLSLLEAAASGRPVVTTDAPGCREAVMHEQTGLLVPVADAKALADALERLIGSPDERSRMGKQARSFAVEHFSVQKMAQETFAVYDELLGSALANEAQ